jgi:arylsulfatase A-like enzyme
VSCAPAETVPPPAPNIVLIVADDLGYGDLGVYGSAEIRTPNIDTLAARGVRFTQAYVTTPLCAPSRAALLTGRDPNRYGYTAATGIYLTQLRRNIGLPRHEIVLSERLLRAGYATGAFGKWHLGVLPVYQPGARGFQEFFGVLAGAHAYFDWGSGLYGPVMRGDEPALGDRYLTDAITDEAVRFLHAHAAERFFVYVAYTAVHAPVEAKEEKLAANAHIEDPRRRAMAAAIGSLDEGVGRIETALRDLGLLDDTLIVFLSDNGGQEPSASNAPLSGGKGTLREGGIRVPLLLSWPRLLEGGRVFDPPVSALDVVPTVLGATGADASGPRLDGVDLLPFLTDRADGVPHESQFWRFLDRGAAIRRGSLKLLREGGVERLFDLALDVGEVNDLSEQRPRLAAELARELDDWIATLGPAGPYWETRSP